ncbi:MAG: HIT domain-containing protein [Bacteroidia bacterium]|nr:HIT domain-containing protein [Bacteroidia bacterium]
MASIFTKIVKGEIPCYKIAETEDFLAFLDIRPLTKGHTLCIPKTEVDNLFDLTDDQYLGLQLFAKEVAIALKKSIECIRIGVVVLGLEVPHAHIHLIPLVKGESDIHFSNPRVQMTPEEMGKLTLAIRENIR